MQLATLGRRLEGRVDALPGNATSVLEIRDVEVVKTSGKTHHLIALPSGRAEDEVLRITAAELAAADTYEVSDYKRVAVPLKSGLGAFVYVGA